MLFLVPGLLLKQLIPEKSTYALNPKPETLNLKP